MRAPVFRHPRALQDEVLLAELVQVIAHGEAGLAPANDDGLDALHHTEPKTEPGSALSDARASSVCSRFLEQKRTCCERVTTVAEAPRQVLFEMIVPDGQGLPRLASRARKS